MVAPFHLKINCVLINEINAFIDAGNLMTDDDYNDGEMACTAHSQRSLTYSHLYWQNKNVHACGNKTLMNFKFARVSQCVCVCMSSK